MKVIYLSHPLAKDTPSYGDRDSVILDPKSSILMGDTSNTTDFRLTNNHIGTHIDVPKHFYDSGSTLTDVSPEKWIFTSVNIIDIPCENGRLIEKEDLITTPIKESVDFLIIKTGFEKFRTENKYWNAYPGISEEACEYLRENFKNLRTVGFDFISLTSPLFKEEGKKAHLSFLNEEDNRPIFIIEDMKLSELKRNPKSVIIAPLLVENGNGGPVTILAVSY
ncbi:MAG: cyclase family protein [Balneolaceae bacterium]|nr:cyclase family protein [Balneolaceae bacterium]MBO6546930.1 cyclase family protein [Balneolaceae bacterium]MBO6649290.1 cyclase family protein [Balneolaceae bacterium]